jgi:predicted metal-binding membrane protein
MPNANWIERLLKYDRAVVLTALFLIIIASWTYILGGASTGMNTFGMTSLSMALGISKQVPLIMAMPMDWTLKYAFVMLFMWWAMMIAMMLPSASPMILLHAKVNRGARASANEAESLLPTAMFTIGYLLVWGVFSTIAVTLQWIFEGTGLLSPMMMNSTSNLFAGSILLFAGAYQLSPIKQACLRHCQGPIQFLSQNWRTGAWGALHMGLRHGSYCLGCCWGLMLILFFGGIMNLYWIVGLALLVLVEKVLPVGRMLTLLTGGLLVIWGFSFIYRGVA